ncbi:hypothetical protein ANTQUA_LOCUS9384 [Anthophora quadrimaculata]
MFSAVGERPFARAHRFIRQEDTHTAHRRHTHTHAATHKQTYTYIHLTRIKCRPNEGGSRREDQKEEKTKCARTIEIRGHAHLRKAGRTIDRKGNHDRSVVCTKRTTNDRPVKSNNNNDDDDDDDDDNDDEDKDNKYKERRERRVLIKKQREKEK